MGHRVIYWNGFNSIFIRVQIDYNTCLCHGINNLLDNTFVETSGINSLKNYNHGSTISSECSFQFAFVPMIRGV